jgi:hypothetical protein
VQIVHSSNGSFVLGKTTLIQSFAQITTVIARTEELGRSNMVKIRILFTKNAYKFELKPILFVF